MKRLMLCAVFLAGCSFYQELDPLPADGGVTDADEGADGSNANSAVDRCIDASDCMALVGAVAACIDGHCEHTCQEGFVDRNDDPERSDSDGCKAACSPISVGSNATAAVRIELHPLANGRWVGAWLDKAGSLVVKEFDADGNETDSRTFANTYLTSDQPFTILAAPDASQESNYHVAREVNDERVLIDFVSGDVTPFASIDGATSPLAGFWNGGQHAVYLAYSSTESSMIRLDTLNGDQRFDAGSVEVVGSDHISLNSIDVPENPQLQTFWSMSLVIDGELFGTDRDGSAESFRRPTQNCGVVVGEVGRSVALSSVELFVADVEDPGGETVVSQVNCPASSTTPFTDPIPDMLDWSFVEVGGVTSVFASTPTELIVSRVASSIRTETFATPAPIQRLAAARSGGVIGLLSVDSAGDVGLRRFDSEGDCL